MHASLRTEPATENIDLDKNHHESFRWHPASRSHSFQSNGNDTQQIHPRLAHGIYYISDLDSVSTVQALETVVRNRQPFCVHPPGYQPGPAIQKNELNGRDIFLALSSGSNGQPKRVQRTHESWITSFKVNATMAKITAQDSYAIVGRASHSLSLYATLEAAHLGADIHMLTELRPDRQLNAMAELQSSILYATPTQLRLLCRQSKTALLKNLAIRQIYCGGGKLDPGTSQLVHEVFSGANIQEFYGATETSFITISDDDTPLGSVGKPYPGVELLIKPIDGENDLPEGEIWVKSPYVFYAYADDGQHAARWHNGYISVGENGRINENGYLFLAGRQSRRVNIADTIVYPEQIEAVLLEHKAVKLCAVVPVVDAKRSAVLIAIVQAPHSTALQQELLVYLRQRVGALKAPREIIFVQHLPLLASGKPDLMTLEQQLSQS